MPKKKQTENVEVVEGVVETVQLTLKEELEIRNNSKALNTIPIAWDQMPTDVRGATGTLTMAFRRFRQTSGMRTFTSGPELQGAIDAFFEMVFTAQAKGVEILPDVELLASFLGVTRNALMSWMRGEANPEFVPVLDLAFNDIALGKKQYALQTKVAPLVYLSDMQNNHGYIAQQNKNDVQITFKNESLSEKQLIDNANLLP